jgi:hypothetical protein
VSSSEKMIIEDLRCEEGREYGVAMSVSTYIRLIRYFGETLTCRAESQNIHLSVLVGTYLQFSHETFLLQ